MKEALDYGRRRQARTGQCLAQSEARFTELDAFQAYLADSKLPADKFVQPDASGDEIPPGDRQVMRPLMLDEELFDLFGFDERDVPAWLVLAVEVPIALDSRTCNNAHKLMLDDRSAMSREVLIA